MKREPMKTQKRDIGLVAFGFLLGALVCFLLVQAVSPPPRSASRVTAASILAAAKLHAGEAPVELSNVLGQTFVIILPGREVPPVDPHTGLEIPRPQSLDLIDFRYKPEFDLQESR